MSDRSSFPDEATLLRSAGDKREENPLLSGVAAMDVEERPERDAADDEFLLEPEDATPLPEELGGARGDVTSTVDAVGPFESPLQRRNSRESLNGSPSPLEGAAVHATDSSPPSSPAEESCRHVVEQPGRPNDSSERYPCGVPAGEPPTVTAGVAEMRTANTGAATAGQPPMSQYVRSCVCTCRILS
ncbi:unnamed protein product [Closterium sp. NIES-54]